MSPESNTESYPAFAHIGLRENPGKNLNQVTCPDRELNPGHLVSRPDALTVTPQNLVPFNAEIQEECMESQKRPYSTLCLADSIESRNNDVGYVCYKRDSTINLNYGLFNDARNYRGYINVEGIEPATSNIEGQRYTNYATDSDTLR
ncbi:hypothetical protein ANN_01055 [Periplaneta americana]|uniref:Uncharacterized protein n=1 Tax=Periplaneta americana TaxID=6978 RepID=A0ABQ8TSH8_PERAM|nr:hypothetical protein ANN_01055 [Periplaneta americana]